MKQRKKRVSITLDSDLLEKMKELAEKDSRTLSQYINMLLKMHAGIKNENGGTPGHAI